MISSTTPTGDQASQNFLIDRVENFLILLLIEDLMAAHSCFGVKETFFFHFFLFLDCGYRKFLHGSVVVHILMHIWATLTRISGLSITQKHEEYSQVYGKNLRVFFFFGR